MRTLRSITLLALAIVFCAVWIASSGFWGDYSGFAAMATLALALTNVT